MPATITPTAADGGWGAVHATGSDVTRFGVGDDVYYAGDITRPGSNAQFHGVDERVPVDSLLFGTRVLDRFLRTC